MKKFLETIKSSFYDPLFYSHIRTQSLGRGVKVLAILGAIGIGFSMLLVLPVFYTFSKSDLPQKLEAAYPDDLVIRIENNELSINKPEPFYIKNNLGIFGEEAPDNLVVFDTTDKLGADLKENSTIVLVKKKYAITYGQNDQLQMIPFSKVATTTVDKSMVVTEIDKAKPYFVPVVLGGGLLIFILMITFGTLFWVLFHMIYILVPACIIFLSMMAMKRNVAFKESYMVALYASIPISIVSFVVFQMILQGNLPNYLYTIILVTTALVNLTSKTERVTE